MKLSLSQRSAACAALVVALTAAATSCAPSTSGGASEKDEKSGTLRVWLFKEVGNKPKERVVDGVLKRFEKRHDGVRVEVEYIPVESRAEKIKGAFNDPESAPDVIEYGNTDTAGYVADGGLADVTPDISEWDEAADMDETAKESATVEDKVYGAPLFVGVRALYYRKDVFRELELKPPKTLSELTSTAERIRAERPDMYGIAVGGAYTYAAMPFIWAHGGELAEKEGDGFKATVGARAAQRGVAAYSDLFGKDNCPPGKCAQMTGNDTVEAFAGGKAGMAIGGDFNRQAVDAGEVKGKYGVVPLPGVKKGDIAPAFAGGNNIGVLKSTSHRTLAVGLMKELAGKKTQRQLFSAMGFLPTFTDTRESAAAEDAFVKPFVRTLDAGAKATPASPGWAEIDAGQVLPGMFQEIVSGKRGVAGASEAAERKMDEAFRK